MQFREFDAREYFQATKRICALCEHTDTSPVPMCRAIARERVEVMDPAAHQTKTRYRALHKRDGLRALSPNPHPFCKNVHRADCTLFAPTVPVQQVVTTMRKAQPK